MLYFYTIQNTVLTHNSQWNCIFFSLQIGSVWDQGNSSIVVFFLWQWYNMFPACFSSLSLIKSRYHSLSSWMRGVRFLCWRTTKEKERVRNRGVWQLEEGCVRAAASSPLLSCYSSSSLCFLPLAGPWPFLREPFWGRRRCPRSCSVHGTPPWPSSLSRSESECMRAEEVGAGTGFIRAGRRVMVQENRQEKRKKEYDVKMMLS